jgi:hypothetical protein
MQGFKNSCKTIKYKANILVGRPSSKYCDYYDDVNIENNGSISSGKNKIYFSSNSEKMLRLFQDELSEQNNLRINSTVCAIEICSHSKSFIIIDVNHTYAVNEPVVLFRLNNLFEFNFIEAQKLVDQKRLCLFSICSQPKQNNHNISYYNDKSITLSWHHQVVFLIKNIFGIVMDLFPFIMKFYIESFHDEGLFLKCLIMMKIDSIQNENEKFNSKIVQDSNLVKETYQKTNHCLMNMKKDPLCCNIIK